MTEQLTISPTEFGIEETKATELTSGLKTILAEREVLKDAYNDVITLEITEENLPMFKTLRLKIRDNRTKGIEVWHKNNKAFFLAGGRFVDAIKNKEVSENEAMETKLEAAEKHFENLEKERIKALHKVRVERLLPFGYDIGNVDFGMMDENMFNAILVGAEKTHNDRVEAEKKAEAERLEAARLEAERIEAQRLENERLKAEAAEKEKQLEKERAEAAKREAELQAKADAERAEAKRLADIEAKKQADLLAKQKAEADRLAAELKAKADAEAKAKAEAEAAEKKRLADEAKAAKAPDKKKLAVMVEALKLPTVDLKENDAKALHNLIEQKFEGFKKWANEQINNL
jgi:colicin import membrane protein